MSELRLRPGMVLGSYPQKKDSHLDDLEQSVARFIDRIKTRLRRKKYSQGYIVREVAKYEKKCQDYSQYNPGITI